MIAKYNYLDVLDMARWALTEYERKEKFWPKVSGPVDLGDHWDDLVKIRNGTFEQSNEGSSVVAELMKEQQS